MLRFLFVILGVLALVAFAISTLRKAPTSQPIPLPTISSVSSSPPYIRKALLRDVTGDLAVGFATQRLIGEDFVVLIDAQLNAPPKGAFYFGWLAKRTPELTLLPLGKLEQVSHDSNLWRVAFRAVTPFTDYDEVWVSRKQKDDNEVEKIILKGKWE
jgi:hypothetical protein